ncbi:MAG: SDR family NAD(P)-dependent oxidoreductase [Pseudomonadota bacterium]|nr:SDR family NAD(P)-dependent oxidoreductase [Pseudomonadota bacterium]
MIRFDDKVAVVTGAGSGLGRDHALLLASRGAKVVVNDLGGSVSGEGGDQSPADKVVQEIKAAGGEAVANYDSVATREGGAAIIQTAIDTWGRIDILICNAGVLRDKSFAKAELDDFEFVFGVHYFGTLYCAHAAWKHMIDQGYGRIVFTTSIAGTSGNFGQSNYGSAKMGMIGLMNTLAIEGFKKNVKVNSISPGALTRMTGNLGMDEDFMAKLRPDLVAPAVAYLCSEQCEATGTTITAAAGGYGRVHMFETKGVQFDPADGVSIEQVAEAFDDISDLGRADPCTPGAEGKIQERLDTLK